MPPSTPGIKVVPDLHAYHNRHCWSSHHPERNALIPFTATPFCSVAKSRSPRRPDTCRTCTRRARPERDFSARYSAAPRRRMTESLSPYCTLSMNSRRCSIRRPDRKRLGFASLTPASKQHRVRIPVRYGQSPSTRRGASPRFWGNPLPFIYVTCRSALRAMTEMPVKAGSQILTVPARAP